MPTPIPPIAPKPRYNETLPGVYGEFGSGNNLQAIYLQTAIRPSYLDKISLISEVRGSERWPVRDLFQREVDTSRITNSLLPYLTSADKIKFFNPLTLTVLPIDRSTGAVLAQMPRVAEGTIEDDEGKWTVRERDRYYRLRWIEGSYEYARLEWNDERSRIVAIDGQHRLAALKRMQRLHDPFPDWRIPVVIVSFRAMTGQHEPPSVLEVVRSLFVYINKEAHQVSEAREILLNDESVNSVATQEMLERSHSNDLKPREKRREDRLPLLFFDWRGQERDGEAVPVPVAVKTVGEISVWMEEYILGEDFSLEQEMALDVSPGGLLKDAFSDGSLDYEASRSVRQRLRDSIVPAVAHVLENFLPYRDYIASLRSLERAYDCGNDLRVHAFDRLRFGSSQEIDSTKEDVDEVERGLHAEIEEIKKKCLRSPMDLDVGMRGVMQAFGNLAFEFSYEPDWHEYAKWFTETLNLVYSDGWFERGSGSKGSEYLRHVIWDQNDNIVNYKKQHAKKALGAYVAILIGEKAPPPVGWCPEWPMVRAGLVDRLEGTLVQGYKKEVHPWLKEQYPNGGRELNEAKKAEAERRAGRQMRRFERALEQFACPEAEKAASGGD